MSEDSKAPSWAGQIPEKEVEQWAALYKARTSFNLPNLSGHDRRFGVLRLEVNSFGQPSPHVSWKMEAIGECQWVGENSERSKALAKH